MEKIRIMRNQRFLTTKRICFFVCMFVVQTMVFTLMAKLVGVEREKDVPPQQKEESHKSTKSKDSSNILGDGWHYAIPHNVGNPKEDESGCPCVCLCLGWSSYANMTNAFANGITNLHECYVSSHEYKTQKERGFPLVALDSLYKFEQKLVSSFNETPAKGKNQ